MFWAHCHWSNQFAKFRLVWQILIAPFAFYLALHTIRVQRMVLCGAKITHSTAPVHRNVIQFQNPCHSSSLYSSENAKCKIMCHCEDACVRGNLLGGVSHRTNSEESMPLEIPTTSLRTGLGMTHDTACSKGCVIASPKGAWQSPEWEIWVMIDELWVM